MVARIAPPKNFICLFDGLKNIPHNYSLCIVGDGPDLPNIKDYAFKTGISDKVLFMGSRNDVAEVLSKSDLFILSSDWEGFPISILEAMRAGLPVVASRVGGIAEAVDDKSSGYLVERMDCGGLQTAIENLLSDINKRKEMGKNGRERYQEQFTTNTMLIKIQAVYDQLIANA
jgi:glycosyltransferase involved in cell wall biosynthesis